MTSRLDRLFVLLETGSTASIRKAAANQLGEVQRSHPHEVLNLLKKVLKYLYHSNWETRLAAAQAVEAILKNVPEWKYQVDVEAVEKEDFEDDIKDEKMTLTNFDIKHLLENGQFLMSSEGKEFDVEKSEENGNKKLQREQLNKQFGFDKLGLKSDQFIDDDDLSEHVTEVSDDNRKSASEILSEEIKSVTGHTGSLSAREVNRLKRKAKLDARASKKAEEEAENEPKKMKIDPLMKKESNGSLNDEDTVNIESQHVDLESSPRWPLESFYDQLITDLFSPRWERRHGAAIGLRELVRRHGESGGRGRKSCNDDSSKIFWGGLCKGSIMEGVGRLILDP